MDHHGAALKQDSRTRRPTGRLGPVGATALSLGPVGFLAVFFIIPVATIVLTGLRPAGQWNLSVVADVIGDSSLRRVIWFTTWQAVASTALTLAVGLPLTYALTRFNFRGRRLLQALVTVPFVLPTVVVAVAFLIALRPDGPVSGLLGNWWGAGPTDLRGTLAAILLAHVFFNVAVVVRVVGGLLEQLDPRLEDAAASLGASRWRTAWEVTLPLARPAIAAAAGITFLFTFTSFGVVLFLGGANHATLEVEIYRQTALLLNLPVAATLSLLQLALVGTLLALGAKRQQDTAVQQPLVRPDRAMPPAKLLGERVFLGTTLTGSAVFLGGPLVLLITRSLRGANGEWSLIWYRTLGDREGSVLGRPALEAVRHSLEFATVATLVAVVVGVCAAVVVVRGPRRWSRLLDVLLVLPLGVSAVTVGFGFIISLDRPPLDLRNSWWLIPMAQALVAVPFVIRVVVPVLLSIDERLREAAGVLGASPARVWREVDLPLMARAIGLAAGFAFAMSLGEFGATVFIARADTITVPVAILRLLGRPGPSNYGQAMALSTILMLMTAVSLLLISRVRVRKLAP